jgi:hypothetical protein
MQHSVMRASKSQLGQHIIRIANEVTVRKKQELDDVPNRLFAERGVRPGEAIGNP